MRSCVRAHRRTDGQMHARMVAREGMCVDVRMGMCVDVGKAFGTFRAHIVMAYIVMASIVMAKLLEPCKPYSCGLHSYGLHSYGKAFGTFRTEYSNSLSSPWKLHARERARLRACLRARWRACGRAGELACRRARVRAIRRTLRAHGHAYLVSSRRAYM